MSVFAKLREDEGTWEDHELRDLEGNPFDGSALLTYVKAICFDGVNTGLYVLTDDDDTYFTCHSISLEFVDDIEVLKLLEREHIV